MSRIRRFRQLNPHLFDDSDSDQNDENLSESESEDEENLVEDSSNTKFGFDFKPIFEEHRPRKGRPSRSGQNQNIETIPESVETCPLKLLLFLYDDNIFDEITKGTFQKAQKLCPEAKVPTSLIIPFRIKNMKFLIFFITSKLIF